MALGKAKKIRKAINSIIWNNMKRNDVYKPKWQESKWGRK